MSADTGPDSVRYRVRYHGRVQGVFFRATSQDLSRQHQVVGTVRNEPDGTVALEAEGPQQEVEAFLGDVERHFSGNIAHVDRQRVAPRGDEHEFRIVH